MDSTKIQQYLDLGTDWIIRFVPKLILTLIILIVGFWIVKKIIRIIVAAINKSNISPEVSTFLQSIIDIILKFIVILIAAGFLGFKISSLIGVLAAIGFAVGLAMQGFLGNFASGITIVFFKPYKVGDWVQISDHFGQVESIQIFSTTLISPGKKTLIIPNGQVTDNIITNFSTQGHIRLELEVSMPYEEDYKKVEQIIMESLKKHPLILQDPPPQVGIETFDSHNIILTVRPFIDPNDYWEATFDAYAIIKKAFHEHGIRMAYSEGIELGTIGA